MVSKKLCPDQEIKLRLKKLFHQGISMEPNLEYTWFT